MESDTEALYRAVIGPWNTDYYLAYFQRADARGYEPITWHWPIFFIGFFWLLFRRQFIWALIYFAFPLVATTIASGFELVSSETIANSFYLLVLIGFLGVYLPLQANGIYHRWCQSLISEARKQFPGQLDTQVEYLSMRGGINRTLPIFILLAFMLISSLSGPVSQIVG